MKLVRLHHKINHAAWYLVPSYFRSLSESAKEWETQLPGVRQDDLADMLALLVNQRPPMSVDANGIATIAISGILGRDLAPIDKLLGMTAYEDVEDDVEEAQEMGAKAVLFDVDSPGGEAQGAAECAAVIANCDLPKASFSSGMDCSAAYFLSCSVDYKVASPSAIVGSIGTIMPWADTSQLWAMMGVKWEPITGQDEAMKGAGMGPSLTDEQRAHFQETVNAMSGAFRDHVSDYRELDFGKLQAGAYPGQQAVEYNLIDKIGTYDDCYNWLMSRL